MSRQPRSVTIGLSGEWLEAVGVPEDLEDWALEEVIDDFLKDNALDVSVALAQWFNDQEPDHELQLP